MSILCGPTYSMIMCAKQHINNAHVERIISANNLLWSVNRLKIETENNQLFAL